MLFPIATLHECQIYFCPSAPPLVQAIHMAGSAAIMGPPGAFATRRWLHLFCSLVALTVVSINGYFLVIFRRDNLPAGAGAVGLPGRVVLGSHVPTGSPGLRCGIMLHSSGWHYLLGLQITECCRLVACISHHPGAYFTPLPLQACRWAGASSWPPTILRSGTTPLARIAWQPALGRTCAACVPVPAQQPAQRAAQQGWRSSGSSASTG